ncbi:diguanylate cyclase (GGDEF domain) [Sulfurimonas gotlandica GD1]|uniref:diguanylate cyclase n=1 Tax=Sulfurimonas gotlandica (strain DSM 19862 / JCM 16533 / GD1) TaxID=929558 RepID=B6BNQ1_SULGG|nr:diguanylate cyclase [Sulfurimonas gotlandica]EDZ61243.1 diguanylate cyclase [Sulfurimonas gotlandica GD1]EHP28854.1 diguanylate cyclase (GGDEF domain) [Sulfurimonas gotlandica GD1]
MPRLTLFLFLFFTTLLTASFILTNQTQKNKNFTLEYLYDDSSSLTIDEIQKTDFTQTIPSQFTKGYHSGTSWFKITLENKSKNEDFILYFTEPFWSSLDLYTKENEEWSVQKNGLDILLKDRSIEDNNPAYHLHIHMGEKRTFYVKGKTVSGHIGEFQIFDKQEFFRPSRITITEAYTIYAFILLGLVLLNIYNFIMTKERIYMYYIAYVFSFILFTSMKSGSYLTLGLHGWDEGLHVVGAFVILFLLLFSGKFLKLNTYMPYMDRVFKIYASVFLVFALLISLSVPYSSLLFNIFSALFFILLLFTTITVWSRGFRCARYYFLALTIFAPTMLLMTLTFNTILDNTDITRYSFLAGAFIEIIFFTLLLTNRYLDTYSANKCLTMQTKELQEIKAQLTIEAKTDLLSGLHNRRYFSEMSQKSFLQAKRYEENLSIILLDLDKFKKINDTYGHQTGDIVIKVTADILKYLNREDDIVARYGGEEFIILLPHTNLYEALVIAENIRKKIESTEIHSESDDIFHVTASIGVAQLDTINDENISKTIQRCDNAMYKAKQRGRNKVFSLS